MRERTSKKHLPANFINRIFNCSFWTMTESFGRRPLILLKKTKHYEHL